MTAAADQLRAAKAPRHPFTRPLRFAFTPPSNPWFGIALMGFVGVVIAIHLLWAPS